MNEFQTTLAAFLAGRAEFGQLDAALLRNLQSDPSIGPAAYASIDELRRTGRLPLQLFVMLKNRIAQSHAVAAQRPGAPPRPGSPPSAAPQPAQPSPQPPRAPPPSSAAPQGAPVGPAPETGGDRTVFGAQRPRHATGSSGPTGTSRPQYAPGVPPAASGGEPGPGAAAPNASRTAAPSAPTAPPLEAEPPAAERTTMGARRPPPTASASQPHSAWSADPSVRAAMTGPVDAAPTGATDTGRTGSGFTGRTGTGTTGGGSGWSDPSKWADQPSIALERGAVLKGRFVLENVVGRGGMGVVFRAKDLRKEEAQDRDPYVAIKILNDEFRRHPESLKALQREARKSQALAHPNIVNVFDFDRDGATVYMTMEFLEGESLDRIIKNPQFEGFPFEEAYPLVEGLGQALRYAHNKQIVHSDFKPGNCFLTKSGVIKVFDFGIAQATKLQGAQHGEVTKFDAGTLGALTPAYASCEMIDGEAPDTRDDIYAFGCVIYELLTGKHPFNKKSAAEARDQKLAPLPIKKLTRRQWRALSRALAFKRADRSANIDELLSGLAKQPFNPARIAVGVAALLIVAAVGYFGVLQWQQQQSDRLVDALQSRDDSRVPAAIEELRSLEVKARDAVLAQVRDPFIDWYESQIRRAVDQNAGRYDYPQAERVLDDADVWYSDSGRLDDLRETMDRDKAELLDQLDRRYGANIEAGRLLPDPNADDVAEVLEILGQADPSNSLLTDTRLTIAYGKQAEAALASKDFDAAKELITLGLARDANDSVLTDLSFKLNAGQQSEVTERRIATLQEQLRTAANLQTVEQLRTLEPAAVELARLAQADPLLRTYYGRVGAALTADVDAHIANRDWAAAQGSIDAVAAVLPPEYSRNAMSRLAAVRGDFDTRRDTLVARVESAVAAGRMPDAQNALRELRQIGADANTVRQASTVLESGYVAAVQGLIGTGKFEDATKTLDAGLQVDAGFTRLAALRDTISQQQNIAEQANAEERERQRLATAQTHKSVIEAFLNQQTATIDDARKALAAADQLAAVAPTDSLAGSRSHEPIATKLAQRAQAFGAADLDKQIAFLDESLALIGDAAVLQTARNDARGRKDRVAAAEREQRLASARGALDELLKNPRYEEADAWVAALREQFTGIRGLAGADDSTVTQGQQRAAAMLLGRSAELREQRQFSKAESLLKFAGEFAPQLEGLTAERQRLAEARTRATQEEAERVRVAKIDGLKQTFTARANNDNINEARATLTELRELLPASDPFIATTAPQALSEIYLRLARGAFDRGDFARADQLAAEGLRANADSAGLRTLAANINIARTARLKTNVDALTAVLERGAGDVNQAKNLLTSIQSDAGSSYAGTETELVGKAQAHINANSRDQAYVTFVSAVFGREFTVPTQANAGRECAPGLAGRGVAGQGRCADNLKNGTDRGPVLVVVPGVGGGAPFAIGRVELPIADWNTYCRLSAKCMPITGAGEDFATNPVTNVTAAAVEEYAAWLTQQAGFTYRLPTREEWVHVASASRSAAVDFNCVTASGRGGAVRQAGAGGPNDWGVLNYVGNVREWVKTGSGYEARGGDYMVRLDQCTAERADPSNGQADERTGFRLVRELRGAGQ
jgi:serine/threonine protein kinase